MKKLTKIGIGIIVLFLLMAVLGGSSDSNQKQETTQAPATTEQKTEKTPVATPDATPVTTQTVYQDVEWAQSVQKYSSLISVDFTNTGKAANNLDCDILASGAQNIVDDTQKALDENSKYTISPKYQEAQKEWELALKDYNSAGKTMVEVANEGKAGNPDVDKINSATSLLDSGTGHMNRATALVKASSV